MEIRKIDRRPPTPTDNVREDIDAMNDYIHYLREQVNFALNQIETEVEANEQAK